MSVFALPKRPFLRTALALLSIGIGSAFGPLQAQVAGPVLIDSNQYAFRYNPAPNLGLFFNTDSSRYEFRNSAGASVFNINPQNGVSFVDGRLGIGGVPSVDFQAFGESRLGGGTSFARFTGEGDLRFEGSADYLVGNNRYAFRAAGDEQYGLFFNAVDFHYEFRDGTASPVFYVDANSGDVVFNGVLSGDGSGLLNLPPPPSSFDSLSVSALLEVQGQGIFLDTVRFGAAVTTMAGELRFIDAVRIGRGALGANAEAIAIGRDARVSSGASGMAIGLNARTNGLRSIVLGDDARALADDAVALGMQAEASNPGSMILGAYGRATADSALAVGLRAKASAKRAVAIGNGAEASADGAQALGSDARAVAEGAFAAGENAQAKGEHAMALGAQSQAHAFSAKALGGQASLQAWGAYGTVLGLYNTIDSTQWRPEWVAAATLPGNNRLLTIGNGHVGARSDAMIVYANGDTEINGDLTVSGTVSFTDPGGSTLRLGPEGLSMDLNEAASEALAERDARIDALEKRVDALLERMQTMEADLGACCLQSLNAASGEDPLTGAELGQNVPNPFTGLTSIRYYVPASAAQAWMAVYDAQGRLITERGLPNTGTATLDLDTRQWPAGRYTYALFVDGKRVAARNMVLQR